ncbi:MAG: DNA processing protein DprA, partial [Mycobacteriaceae bacterium]|nr:DNA processing protein DprA [Mycobacteriaceae bacterium]
MNDEQLAWAYLSRVVEPPCAELAALVATAGPVDAAQRIKRGDVAGQLARRTQARRHEDRAEDDLGRSAQLGGRLVTPADADWPTLAFTSF